MTHKLNNGNTFDHVKANNFLFVPTPDSPLWRGSDSGDAFYANLKTQPADWMYRTRTISYTDNSHNYRTQEFNTIDWANSVVMIGCSNVYGVGVDDIDTLPAQLSRLINKPVINLGVGGSSMLFALHNNLILNEVYPTPRAVINVWTDLSRATYYQKASINHHGAWEMRRNNYMDMWNRDEYNPKLNAHFISMAARQIWKPQCEYYEATVFPSTAEAVGCDLYTLDMDRARDMGHPGIDNLGHIAGCIAERMSL